MNEDLVVRLSTHPFMTWLVKNVASRIDPILFRATGGRLTSFGPPAMPMLTLTSTGRRSGKLRSVHLACVPDEGDYLVVASAMGQQKHPAWRYNLEADPAVEVQTQGERFAGRADMLSETEKGAVWSNLRRAIPQLAVYEKRTDRDIRVFRIRKLQE